MQYLKSILLLLKRIWVVIKTSPIAGLIGIETAESVGTAAVFFLVKGAVMIAWGVFLLGFWSYLAGTSFRDLILENPLSGAPAISLYLISHAFPLKLLFGSCLGYVSWRFTCIPAAILMSRIIKVLPGA